MLQSVPDKIPFDSRARGYLEFHTNPSNNRSSYSESIQRPYQNKLQIPPEIFDEQFKTKQLQSKNKSIITSFSIGAASNSQTSSYWLSRKTNVSHGNRSKYISTNNSMASLFMAIVSYSNFSPLCSFLAENSVVRRDMIRLAILLDSCSDCKRSCSKISHSLRARLSNFEESFH